MTTTATPTIELTRALLQAVLSWSHADAMVNSGFIDCDWETFRTYDGTQAERAQVIIDQMTYADGVWSYCNPDGNVFTNGVKVTTTAFTMYKTDKALVVSKAPTALTGFNMQYYYTLDGSELLCVDVRQCTNPLEFDPANQRLNDLITYGKEADCVHLMRYSKEHRLERRLCITMAAWNACGRNVNTAMVGKDIPYIYHDVVTSLKSGKVENRAVYRFTKPNTRTMVSSAVLVDGVEVASYFHSSVNARKGLEDALYMGIRDTSEDGRTLIVRNMTGHNCTYIKEGGTVERPERYVMIRNGREPELIIGLPANLN